MEKKQIHNKCKVILPIRVGKKVKFSNEQNQLCESKVCSIDKVTVSNDTLFITFSTRNSIYSNCAAKISDQGITHELYPGLYVSMGGADRVILNILYEVNQHGIIAGTNDKKWIFGEFSNPQSKV